MAPPAEKSEPVPEIPLTPSLEAWQAMPAIARERFIEEVNTILSSPPYFMGESVPHHKAKRRAADRLRKHFDAIGRVIYLAEELSVFYPNERAFTPDILAVRDVAESEDDERRAWVVADESRGIDQGGRYASAVLGLDLAVVNGKLEFYYGMSEIFGSDDLIARLQIMMGSLEAKAEQAKAEAEQAKAEAEQAILALQESVLAIAHARGLVPSEAEIDSIQACSDPAMLKRWLLRAATANSMSDVLAYSP